MNFCLFLSMFLSNILWKERKMEREANNVKAIGRKFRKKEIKDGKAAERTLK